MIERQRLRQWLERFPSLTIGLVGDLFLDRYLDIDPQLHELSVETGLEAHQVTRIRNSPGALGTVINNLAALGVGRLVPLAVIGDDGQAYDLLKELKRLPVETAHVLRDAARTTPTYTKPMKQDASGAWRELNRLDLRNRTPLPRETEDQVIQHLEELWKTTDGLVALDQVNEEGWGVVTPKVRERLGALARRQPEKLLFADSRAHIGKFRGGYLKPNLVECLRGLGRPADEQALLALPAGERIELAKEAATALAAQTGGRVFCTLGALGILVVDGRRPAELVPGCPVSGPVDPVGAGDSATSGIVASLLCGASMAEAAAVGNLVASITVTQIGVTGTATPAQLLQRCEA